MPTNVRLRRVAFEDNVCSKRKVVFAHLDQEVYVQDRTLGNLLLCGRISEVKDDSYLIEIDREKTEEYLYNNLVLLLEGY